MVRSRKKLLLLGLLALGFMSLVYAFLNSRPEMIADSSLRVPEEARPEFDRLVNISPNVRINEPADPSVIETARLLDDAEKSQGGEALVGALQSTLSNDAEPTGVLVEQTVVEVNTEGTVESSVAVVTESEVAPESDVVKAGQDDVSDSASDLQAAEAESVTEEWVTEAAEPSDVVLITDQDGFVDLNLADKKPVSFELIEGDDIIIDDVNEVMEQFTTPPVAVSEAVSSDVDDEQAEIVADLEEFDVPEQDLIAGKGGISEQDMRLSEGESLQDLTQLPEADPLLMAGSDRVSLEYQASYKKLSTVVGLLKEADAENAAIKDRFDEVANENRQLAQIIRDIDVKIKALTEAN